MKVGIFFCDIAGTSSYYTKKLYKELFEKLEEVREKEKLDKLIFSFITGDEEHYLKSYIKKIQPFLNDKITAGIHFFPRGCIKQDGEILLNENQRISKVSKILTELQYTSHDDELLWMGYADDYLKPYDIYIIDKYAPKSIRFNFFKPSAWNLTESMEDFNDMRVYITETQETQGLIECISKFLRP